MHIAEQEPASDHLTFTRWVAGILLRWRMVVAAAIGAVLLGLVATLIVPPVYRAEASFVANSSSGAKLQGGSGGGALGGLLQQFGGSMGGDPSESPNFYVELLTSRELLTRLLDSKFPNPRTANLRDSATLLDILKIKKPDRAAQLETAVKSLSKAIAPGIDAKTNLVWFSVDEQWPELSAQVANRLIDLVSSFNREKRMSSAKAKREFLQMRHDSARTALRDAEERQRLFLEQNRGLIMAPSLKFEEQRLTRDVDLANDLYINLDKQLEVARIDEINDAALITVIDSAVVPRKARWPRYGVMVFTALILGTLAGLTLAGSAAVMADWRERNPDSWNDFRSARATMRREFAAMLGFKRKNLVTPTPASVSSPPEERIARAQRPVA
ncbi:MAG TPA: GNVR domain-containing protein [Gemmatimonadaceae bacterium]|nr:GNVR domain-containing protein [Gemmatimonadaceae bacterium]